MEYDLTYIYVMLGILFFGLIIAIILAIVLPLVVGGQTGATGSTGATGATGPSSFVSVAMGMRYNQPLSLKVNTASPWTFNDLLILTFNNFISGKQNLLSNNLFKPTLTGTWNFDYNITFFSPNFTGATEIIVFIVLYRSDNTIIDSNIYGLLPTTQGYSSMASGSIPFNVSSSDLNSGYSYNIGLYAQSSGGGEPTNVNIVPYLPASSTSGNPATFNLTKITFSLINS